MQKIDYSEIQKDVCSDLDFRGVYADFTNDFIVGITCYDEFTADYGFIDVYFKSDRCYRCLYDRCTGLKVCKFYEVKKQRS